MSDVVSQLNYIECIIKQCEKSQLVSFDYQDSFFSLHFDKTFRNETDSKSSIIELNKWNLEKNLEKNLEEVAAMQELERNSVDREDIITIRSTFVGNIEFSNLIKLGQGNVHINKGDVICSVEAMKIYNDIISPVSGTIEEILVEDCSLVEFEQSLVKVRIDKDE